MSRGTAEGPALGEALEGQLAADNSRLPETHVDSGARDTDTRAFWVQASPPDGVPLAAASVWQMTVRPRGSSDVLLDLQVRTKETGWGACQELDGALSERGMRRSHGWGDGPRRSLVAWLKAPAAVIGEV